MKMRMPKSMGSESHSSSKPSQGKAEQLAAQQVGDEAARMLEAPDILPMKIPEEPGQQDAAPVVVDGEVDAPAPASEAKEENPSPAQEVDGTVQFQSIADGWQPAQPEKPSDTLPPEPPEHFAREMYEQALADAKESLCQATLARADLEAELKAIKTEEKNALKLVVKIKAGGWQRYLPPPPKAVTAEAAGEDAGNVEPQPSRPQGDTSSVDADAWKAVALSALELKPALHEKLSEAGISTIGDLENLRAAISENKKEWPKGIGTAKITQIEDAVLNWLAQNRDRQVVVEVTQVTQAETPDTHPEPAAELSPFKYPSQEAWAKFTEKQQTKWIEERADELGNLVGVEPEFETDDEALAFDEGQEAYSEGDSLENCPHDPGLIMDAWIIGWLTALDDGDTRKQKPEPAKASPALPSGEVDLDDL